jgi:regulator of protease activity HflC (stomatin/prohibitin superfamily)
MFLVPLIGVGACIKVVPAGEVGVYDTFGKVGDTVMHPGLTLVNPLARTILFSVKTKKVDMAADVPSKEGLIVNCELTVQYRLDSQHVVDLYKKVGWDYEDVIIQPAVRSALRQATANRVSCN